MTVWTESFNDADHNTPPDQTWTGGIRCYSNQGRGSTTTPEACTAGSSFSDGYVEAAVNHSSAIGIGPAIRITDTSNNYHVRLSSSPDVYKRVAGTDTLLISGSGSHTNGDVYRVTVSGTALELFRNGGSIGTATDSAHSSGNAGTYANSGANTRLIEDWEASDSLGGATANPLAGKLSLMGVGI